MTALALFLRQLGKFMRFCLSQEPVKFTIQRLLKLVQYFHILLNQVRRRPSSPRSPQTTNQSPCNGLPSSGTVTCYSQVPPNISVLPDSPVLSNVTQPAPHLSLSLSRPSSDYLSPRSALQGREDGPGRPYAHSEPAMSLHRITSRASSHLSVGSRDSKKAPSVRSLRRTHVNPGVTTVRTSVQASENMSVHAIPLPLSQNDAASSEVVSFAEAPAMHCIFVTNRYERQVKMLVLSYPICSFMDLSKPCLKTSAGS